MKCVLSDWSGEAEWSSGAEWRPKTVIRRTCSFCSKRVAPGREIQSTGRHGNKATGRQPVPQLTDVGLLGSPVPPAVFGGAVPGAHPDQFGAR
jgi:hypothetical protein